jgi:nucleoside-diphosphate-sugar epimerase
MIAVTGGAGAMGLRLCRLLLAQGERVHVIGLPDPEGEAKLGAMGVSFRLADIRDPLALRAAFEGATKVVHLAAVVLSRRNPGLFREVNVDGTRNVLQAAEAARVERFVHVSSISVEYRHQNHYSRSKRDAEDLVRRSRLDWTILRPTLAWGDPMAAEYAAFARAVCRWRVLPLPRGGSAVKSPVHLDDLVEAFSRALRSSDVSRIHLALPGPERITLAGMAARLRRDRGRLGWTLPVPSIASALLVQAHARLWIRMGLEPLADRQTWTGLAEDAAPDLDPAARLLSWNPRPFDPSDDGLPRKGNA